MSDQPTPLYREATECTSVKRLGFHYPDPMSPTVGDECEDCGAKVAWVVSVVACEHGNIDGHLIASGPGWADGLRECPGAGIGDNDAV